MERTLFFPGQEIALFEQNVGRDHTPVRFTIKECIGMGASSVAYEASSDAGLPVVLKQFSPTAQRLDNADYAALEKRFVKAHQRQKEFINSPAMSNITAALTGFYRDSYGIPWIAVRGTFSRAYSHIAAEQDLWDNLKRIRLLAEGVMAFHNAGYLMLDITPDNILFIQDLGISAVSFFDMDSIVSRKELEEALLIGKSFPILSTTPYAAPELNDSGLGAELSEIGTGSDVYSIGAVLYFALFGEAPRSSRSAIAWKNSIPGKKYDFSGVNGLGDAPEACRMLNKILQRTLCISPEGRFGDCGELIRELDALLTLQLPRTLQLHSRVPDSAAEFTGRSRELAQLSRWLREGASPIAITGMAGQGKTELALQLAKQNPSFVFHFAPFSDSIRETLLALPWENLPEKAEEETEDSERMELVWAYLSKLDRNTVLLLDNFDAPDETRSRALLDDPDYERLCSLPIRILFTSRYPFAAEKALRLEGMSEEELLCLCQSMLPEEPSADLKRLIARLHGHTLSIAIAARSLASQDRKGSVAKLCEKLAVAEKKTKTKEGETDPAYALKQLSRLFGCLALEQNSCLLLSFFSLVPLSGISSALLGALFTEEQWRTATTLRKCGWLRHDEDTRLWSVHPLLQQLFREEKKCRPRKEQLAPLITRLQKVEETLTVQQSMDAVLKRQLDALYANYTRRAAPDTRGKRIAWSTAAAALLLILLGMGFFFTYRSKVQRKDPSQLGFESAMIELEIMPRDTMEPEDLAADKELLQQRLRIITGKRRLTLTETEEGFYVKIPLSSLIRQGGDLGYVLQECVFLPGQLYYGITNQGIYHYNDLALESTECRIRTGVLHYTDSVGDLIYTEEDSPYLQLLLSEENQALVTELKEESPQTGEESFFRNTDNRNHIPVISGTEEGVYSLVDPKISLPALYESLIYSYTHEPLKGEYRCVYDISPRVLWSESEGKLMGRNQVPRDELTGEVQGICFVVKEYKGELTRQEYEENRKEILERMDCLNLDYAFGNGIANPDEIYVAIAAESSSLLHMKLLQCRDVSIRTVTGQHLKCFDEIQEMSAQILNLPDSRYALRVCFSKQNTGYSDNGESFRSAMEQAKVHGIEELFLCVDDQPWLQAAVETADLDACTLDFTRMRILAGEELGEEHLGLLRLLAYLCSGPRRLSYEVSSQNLRGDNPLFCFTERSPEQILFNEFFAAYPQIEWNYDGEILYVHLNYEPRDDFILQGFNFAEKMITELDLLSTCCHSVFINFGRGEGVCRLVITYESQPGWWITGERDIEGVQPGYVSFTGVCYGKAYDDFAEEFLHEYVRREFHRYYDYEKWGLDYRDSFESVTRYGWDNLYLVIKNVSEVT